jgi:hypothetical protein
MLTSLGVRLAYLIFVALVASLTGSVLGSVRRVYTRRFGNQGRAGIQWGMPAAQMGTFAFAALLIVSGLLDRNPYLLLMPGLTIVGILAVVAVFLFREEVRSLFIGEESQGAVPSGDGRLRETPGGPQQPRIVVSYRREDTGHVAGRLHDRLSSEFGSEFVFMDIDNIEPGSDFKEAIESAVEAADVLVAVIGTRWLSLTDREGMRRLDDPSDYVRLEIGTAFGRDIRVIPVLTNDAEMPAESELPDDLRPLSRRQAIEVGHKSFHSNVDDLVRSVRNVRS